jgi:hypothetical protein
VPVFADCARSGITDLDWRSRTMQHSDIAGTIKPWVMTRRGIRGFLQYWSR